MCAKVHREYQIIMRDTSGMEIRIGDGGKGISALSIMLNFLNKENIFM